MKGNGENDKLLIANYILPEQFVLRNSRFCGSLQGKPIECIINGINTRYARYVTYHSGNCVVDDTVSARMEALANWLVDSPRCSLLLIGGTGSGKTSIAITLAQALQLDKVGVCFTSATDIIRSFLHDANGDLSLQKYFRYRVLVIDDLGLEPTKCYQYGTQYTPIEDIIRKRSDMRMITIVCTSLNQNELRERYPASIYDRLGFEYEHLFLGNESYRRVLNEKLIQQQ